MYYSMRILTPTEKTTELFKTKTALIKKLRKILDNYKRHNVINNYGDFDENYHYYHMTNNDIIETFKII